MKIFIFADLEGISGVYARDQVMSTGSRLSEGRDYLTADVNACAEGCKRAGAEKVVVRDGHGLSCSLRWEKLSSYIDEAICGSCGSERFVGIEEYDAVILLGYHAMAGTLGGVLEHSMSSSSVQNYWANGKKIGELGIDAGIAGEHGVPVIMVSGDDKICAEANELIPWAKTAQVKKGLTTFGASLLPPEKAHALIRDTAEQAVKDIKNMKPLVYPTPITFRVENMERIPLPNVRSKPYIRIIDGRTYEFEAPTMEDAIFRTM